MSSQTNTTVDTMHKNKVGLQIMPEDNQEKANKILWDTLMPVNRELTESRLESNTLENPQVPEQLKFTKAEKRMVKQAEKLLEKQYQDFINNNDVVEL